MLVVRQVGPGVVPYFLDGRSAGSWSPGATRLLGLAGPVAAGDLRSVLLGRDPSTGRFLPRVRPARRRAGWDLIFSAPKSVSLLDGAGAGSDTVAGAHCSAVDSLVEYLEQRLAVPGPGADGRARQAAGLIAARFDHRTSAASEPHLHSHVLVANLTTSGGVWSAVQNWDWVINRSALSALYQLSLRRELELRGWQLEWRLRPDGLADVAGVPRAAVRAASTQSRLARGVGPFAARAAAVPQAWIERTRLAGFDTSRSTGSRPLASAAGCRPDLGDPGLVRAVEARLATRRSDFREADVIVALGASHAGGASPWEASDWAQAFCRHSPPVPSPTTGGRWTTALARRADDRLVESLEAHRASGDRGTVTVLASAAGSTSLLAQAEFIDQARAGWSERGLKAVVAAPTAGAATRWWVLTGLPAHHPGQPADVIVVDQADRRTTAELLGLVDEARARRAHLILAEGGTMPRLTNFASHGLAEFAGRGPRVSCPEGPVWSPRPPGPERGPLVGREAAAALLSGWADRGPAALLVGLGLEEVRALNAAARHMLASAAPGPASRPRCPAVFVPGDRVTVVRSGGGRPPYGTFGRVLSADDRRGGVTIRWDGSADARTYGRNLLVGFGYGWAVTPNLAARSGQAVDVLGPAGSVPRLRSLIRSSLDPAGPGSTPDRHLGLSR